MAVLQPHDRIALARSRALRRSVRARVAAVVAVIAAAWWAHAATAGTQDMGHRAAAEETAALSQPNAEQQPLGSGTRSAAGSSAANPSLPSASPSTAPATARTTSSSFTEIARTGGALVVVLGLIGGAWWWLRRTGIAPAQRGGAFEVVARYPMGRGQQVLIARFGPRVLCLQQTREGLRTLSELTDQDDVTTLMAQARAGSRAFGGALGGTAASSTSGASSVPSASSPSGRPDRTLDLRGRTA